MQVIPASDNDKRPSATYEYYIIIPIDGNKVTLYLLWAASRDPATEEFVYATGPLQYSSRDRKSKTTQGNF